MRSAELESSQSHLESVQSHYKELQFQLRETSERLAMAEEEISGLRTSLAGQGSSASTEDIARLLLETEGRYEARLSEARNKILVLEKERAQSDEEWSRSSNEKSRTIERLRRDLGGMELEKDRVAAMQQGSDAIVAELELKVRESDSARQAQAEELQDTQEQMLAVRDREVGLGQELHDLNEKVEALNLQIEGLKGHEVQLRTHNRVTLLFPFFSMV